MESFELMRKPVVLNDMDRSSDLYVDDSNEIKVRIREEIWYGEFEAPINYYGISDEEPNIKGVSNGHRYKVCVADNCVYPERYTNVMVYVAKDRVIHWFVVVKNV